MLKEGAAATRYVLNRANKDVLVGSVTFFVMWCVARACADEAPHTNVPPWLSLPGHFYPIKPMLDMAPLCDCVYLSSLEATHGRVHVASLCDRVCLSSLEAKHGRTQCPCLEEVVLQPVVGDALVGNENWARTRNETENAEADATWRDMGALTQRGVFHPAWFYTTTYEC